VINARGAGESGLGRMMYLHLAATAADTLIVTALASTIFFAVPTDAARGRVALSLAITMIPFALLAPLIGPLLDRVPHGRRYALATTMVVRAFLAWVMAGAIATSADGASIGLYLAACGFLVCQKAYLVTRAAAVPRVLPIGTGLVAANSRLSLAGVVAMIVAAPAGAGFTALTDPAWTLRLAFVVFAGGTALALMLPPRVDSAHGELAARLTASDPAEHAAPGAPAASARPQRPVRRGLGRRGTLALRGNAVLRAFSGFLTLFLAFRLRSEPIGGLDPAVLVAVVIAVFGLGSGAGTALGALVRTIRPDRAVVAVTVVAALASGCAALAYGLWTVLAGAFAAGLAQSLAKLSLDALIQSDVPESVRSSAFARSETVLQLAWVAGGGIGLIAPVPGPWGLGIGAALTVIAAVATRVSPGRSPHFSYHPAGPVTTAGPGQTTTRSLPPAR
jgi:MFS family permease